MIIRDNSSYSVSSVARRCFAAARWSFHRCIPCVHPSERLSEINFSQNMRSHSHSSGNHLAQDGIDLSEQKKKLEKWVENAPSAVEREARLMLSRQIQFNDSGSVLNVSNLMLSEITDLAIPIGDLYVEGDLDLSDCECLTCLPENLRVGGNLDLEGCESLTHLPENLHVGGILDLKDNISLTCLPENLQVGGNLDLEGCGNLTHLPNNFQVGGSLDLEGCTSLIDLGENLQVGGNLHLSFSANLVRLPERLQVGGTLDLEGCENLTALPENLQVGESLNLRDCKSLARMPETLRVEKDLYLSGCRSLTRLPKYLQVGGNLYLTGCRNLTRLPGNLCVGGNIDLERCENLLSLPEDLQVGGDIDLRGCTQLTALPNWVSQLGARSNDGWPRLVDLTNTGLSQVILERLLALNLPGVQFIFGHEAREHREYGTLKEAMLSWASDDENIIYNTENWHLNHQQRHQLKTFLSRLHQTAEALNRNTVGNLRHRVHALLRHMNDNLRDYRAQALERISHGLESCDDRVILIMNQIELLMRVREAEEAENPDASLRDLGRGLLALEVVHRHAADKCERTYFVDPIEVYLALEIHLNQELQLPLCTKNMFFESCAFLTDQEIDSARQEARAALTDSVRVDHFMNQWEPWQRHQRVMQSQQLTWGELPASDRKFNTDDICVISGCGLEELVDPICVGNSLYSLAEFKRWWVEHGTNPATCTPVAMDEIRKVSL